MDVGTCGMRPIGCLILVKTGKRLSRGIWSCFNKEVMSHLCDSTVVGPAAWRDDVRASRKYYEINSNTIYVL